MDVALHLVIRSFVYVLEAIIAFKSAGGCHMWLLLSVSFKLASSTIFIGTLSFFVLSSTTVTTPTWLLQRSKLNQQKCLSVSFGISIIAFYNLESLKTWRFELSPSSQSSIWKRSFSYVSDSSLSFWFMSCGSSYTSLGTLESFFARWSQWNSVCLVGMAHPVMTRDGR